MDFIAIANSQAIQYKEHQEFLIANCLAQSRALMLGEKQTDNFKICPGNRPSTTILIKELTAKNLGMLIALYEHKVLVQGLIWDIASFDQWGVELGKKLANELISQLKKPNNSLQNSFDSSTNGLLDAYTSFINN
jgi:glucose-6-phosphate isomerase